MQLKQICACMCAYVYLQLFYNLRAKLIVNVECILFYCRLVAFEQLLLFSIDLYCYVLHLLSICMRIYYIFILKLNLLFFLSLRGFLFGVM